MPANKFVLKGPLVEIEYTVGVTPGIPALIYTSGAVRRSFTQAEITTEDTGLGNLISVSLLRTIDTGGERFGFFLPFIEVAPGQVAHFHSVGVYERFAGPNSVPRRPSTWTSIELRGTAQGAIVPL